MIIIFSATQTWLSLVALFSWSSSVVSQLYPSSCAGYLSAGVNSSYPISILLNSQFVTKTVLCYFIPRVDNPSVIDAWTTVASCTTTNFNFSELAALADSMTRVRFMTPVINGTYMESITSDAISRFQSNYTGVRSLDFPDTQLSSLYYTSANFASAGYVLGGQTACSTASSMLSNSVFPTFWSCNNNRGLHICPPQTCASSLSCFWDWSVRNPADFPIVIALSGGVAITVNAATLNVGLAARLSFDGACKETIDSSGALAGPIVSKTYGSLLYTSPSASATNTPALDLTANNVTLGVAAVSPGYNWLLPSQSTGSTLSCWLYVSPLPPSASNSVVVTLGSNDLAGNFALRIELTSNPLGVLARENRMNFVGVVTTPGTGITATPAFALQPSRWYHVAVTTGSYDVMRLWVNGTLVSQASYVSTGLLAPQFNTSLSMNTLQVGTGLINQNCFQGLIDEVRYYTRELLAQEIWLLANNLTLYTSSYTPCPTSAPTSGPRSEIPSEGPTLMPSPSPVTSLPTSSLPTSSQPTSSLPTSSLPTSSQPTSSQPTSSLPTSSLPTSSHPTSSLPSSNSPMTFAPSKSPTSEVPSNLPSTESPTLFPTSTPTTESPTLVHPPTSPPISSSANQAAGSNTAVVAGSIIGVLIAVGLIIALVLLLRVRSRSAYGLPALTAATPKVFQDDMAADTEDFTANPLTDQSAGFA